MASEKKSDASLPGFAERLQALVDHFNEGNRAAFARRIGITSQKLGSYLNDGVVPGADVVSKMMDALSGLRITWLLKGEGEMLRAQSAPETPPPSLPREDRPARPPHRSEGIPVVSSIQAGQMTAFDVARYAEDFLPLDPDGLGLVRGDVLFGLRVRNDSMEPWMYQGDVVVCSGVQRVSPGDDVAVYLFESGESTVKRLDGHDERARRLRLRPINPVYESFSVDLKQGDQIFRVVFIWRLAAKRYRSHFE